MPTNTNNIRNQMPFVLDGNPETARETTPHALGQLGTLVSVGSKSYQHVRFDTGAVAAAAIAPAANQVVFWKDRDDFIVTNDSRFSAAGRNAVAGRLGYAHTAGDYIFIQRGGLGSTKVSGSPAVGDRAIANSGTAADLAVVSAGTQVTYVSVGVFYSVAAGGNADVDWSIGDNV